MLQVGQCTMKCYGDCVLCGTVPPVGKLMRVQACRDDVLDILKDEPLKALHDDWGEGDWAIVI